MSRLILMAKDFLTGSLIIIPLGLTWLIVTMSFNKKEDGSGMGIFGVLCGKVIRRFIK